MKKFIFKHLPGTLQFFASGNQQKQNPRYEYYNPECEQAGIKGIKEFLGHLIIFMALVIFLWAIMLLIVDESFLKIFWP